VSDASACQSALSAPINVTVVALPSKPVIALTGNSTFCAGDSAVLTAPLSTSYLWSNGATSQSIVVKQNGNYRVQIKNEQGCESPLSDAVTITTWQLPPTPAIEQINLDTLTATVSGTVYEWRKEGVVLPANTKKITVSGDGQYTVRIKDANSCYSAFSQAFNFTMADKSLLNKVSLFPNPSPGEFTVLVENSTSATVHIQVITLLGQQLYTYTYLNSAKDFRRKIGLPLLAQGAYLLKLIVGEEVVYKKIVIQ
jgi:hypothetical protein